MDLEDQLAALEENLSKPAFRDLGKAFETSLKASRHLPRSERDAWWSRYQSLWQRRKDLMAERHRESAAARDRYINELFSIDYSPDGAPVLSSPFTRYGRMGEKVRSARERLKEIGATVKADRSLEPADRKVVNDRISGVWDKLRQQEEITFSVHQEKADSLYNESSRAVESMAPGQAAGVLKAAQAEIRSLWLPRDRRERYREWFDALWSKLRAERGEHDSQWRERQQQGLARLLAARDKAHDALRRVRENISNNRDRLGAARSSEFADRVSEWIREGEEKERDIERSIDELESKIRDAEERLSGKRR